MSSYGLSRQLHLNVDVLMTNIDLMTVDRQKNMILANKNRDD